MQGTVARLIEECDGIPKKWGNKFPTHRDDFMTEMKLGIMIAVNKYGEEVDTPLVRTIVGRRCQEYISHIPVVRIPPTTGRRFKAGMKDTMISTTVYIEEDPVYSLCDEKDVIATICVTTTEHEILLLRLEGFNQTEISSRLGIPQQRVSDMILKIRSQFNDTKCIR